MYIRYAIILMLVLAPFPVMAESTDERFNGMPVGFTDKGHPYIGNPDAPIVLEEWSDYLCPYCGRHFSQTLPKLLEQQVATGQVLLVFRDFPLKSLHPNAPAGHAAARCVGQQGASLYWKMHDELFKRQGQWNRGADAEANLLDLVESIGADGEKAQACIDEQQELGEVEQSVALGRSMGFHGTPSFRFLSRKDGREYQFAGAQSIDHFAFYANVFLEGRELPREPGQEEPELPFWASPEGLKPDPDRPGYTMAGDAYKGNPESELVVIEFVDFQCPPCREHALESQPVIDEALVEKGRILWVTKHFPLRIHPHAVLAAVTAECAGSQGRFWEMHHRLFEDTDRWATEGAERDLVALAKDMNLDMARFEACFNSREGMQYVLDDLYDAQGVVRRTPTLIVLQDGRANTARPMPGEQFVSLLSERLGD